MGALLWLGKPGTSPPTARKRLEEAPLVTKALREAQMKEKLQRYPKVQVGGLPLAAAQACVASGRPRARRPHVGGETSVFSHVHPGVRRIQPVASA